MAKVKFIRKETKEQINNLDIVDGQFIVCGDGSVYVDYGTERKSIGGTPDTSMSDTSVNSVQNKVIKKYVDTKTKEAKEYTDEKLIYSTDEKIVGTWIDGKPLYRKVINLSDLRTDTYIQIEVASNALIKKYEGYIQRANGASLDDLPLSVRSSKKIEYKIDSTFSNNLTGAYAIVYYTKTTD